jgi:hypothetical protein
MKQVLTCDMIKEFLRAASIKKKEVNKDKFIAILCLDYNLSRRNVVEKLNILINAEFVVVTTNELNEQVLQWQE